ncbi:type I phosphodiesterase/nucleotide pyrophosphatase 2 [Methanocaldococcus bathoardescens]|uniref:Type I phosphodiesterase/nucleotide pyrophosphatase 2 n=1 Tax=Methanocaldococcus bathoardescens TaxID=1301915 RepID=A0A076L9P1_9EURY|nr:alkaline phosphatase family protein [Methanocaldococcus bathoardescens]AIJ04926.1 type I phosphodiesterase/nucleotide pyrophosphatase 2 [Methanocaldococcus bathoardescens]
MVRVVVIGLDGATWDLIKPWADTGELPTFKKLMENGAWGVLESTIPPITCPAWVSMLTGKNPGKLGIYYFRQPNWDTMQMENVKIDWDKYRPLWKILNYHGLVTNIINTPTATPKPNGYKGVYIHCPIMGSSDEEKFAYPEFVREKIKKIGYERIVTKPPEEIGEDEYISKVYEITKKKIAIAFDLFQNTKWDLFFFTIFYTDQMKHYFWHYMDPNHPKHKPSKYQNAILEFYKFIDTKLNDFLDSLTEEDILFLVSDHGHGGMYREVNYNIYFNEMGLLKFKGQTTKIVKHKKLYNLLRKLYSFRLIKVIVENINFMKRLKKEIRIDMENIDWNQTLAYNPTPNAIYINLIGREKYGIVDKKDYDIVREKVIAILKNLEDPNTNEKVVEKIWKKEEIYSGEYLEIMPDILIEPINETSYINYGFDNLWKGQTFSEPTPLTYSTHTLRGIFLAYGKGIKKGYKIENAKIYDIVPTILHIFGLPIPNDMDGRVLMEIFEKDSEFVKREPKYVDPSYYEKKQEDEKLKKAIKNLKLKGKI